MKQRLILLTVLAFSLVGCSADEKMFTATSEHWDGDVFVQKVNGEQQLTFTLRYTHDAAAIAGKDYTLSLQSPFSESERKDVIGEDGIIQPNSPTQCRQCLDDDQNLQVTMTIQLDGQTEALVFEPK